MILLCPPEKSTQFHYPLDPKKIRAEGSIHKDTTYQGSDRQDFYRHGKKKTKKKKKKENKQTKRRPRLGLPIGNPVINFTIAYIQYSLSNLCNAKLSLVIAQEGFVSVAARRHEFITFV